MSQIESGPANVPRPRRSRRWWFLGVVGLLAALAIGGVWLLPEQYDRGTRVLLNFVIVVTASAATLAWLFFMARLPVKVRLAGLVALVLLAVLVPASVRRVEFSGDMLPTFFFRWSPDRYDVLEAHRKSREHDATLARDEGPLTEADEVARLWGSSAYRGPYREGVVDTPRLAHDWSRTSPKLMWRQPCGGGYASLVTVGLHVITIEQRRDHEAIVSYDFDSGRERWIYEYPALFSETLGGDGPRATPTIYENHLVALGATGVLTCLDLTGKLKWSVNVLEQNGSGNLDWGMSGSPLGLESQQTILVNPGTQKGTEHSRALLAYDIATGKLKWSAGTTKAGYASPAYGGIGGQRSIVIFDAAGLAVCEPYGGKEICRTPWKSDFDINASQPVVLSGNRVLITSASGAALYKLEQHDDNTWSFHELWKNRNMKCSYSTPIAYKGYLYGIDENILACIDLNSGKRMWKDRRGQYGHGQLLIANDVLVVLAETGELALVEATPERFNELGRIQAIEGKTWNVPMMLGSRIFVRNHLEMASYTLPVEQPAPSESIGNPTNTGKSSP